MNTGHIQTSARTMTILRERFRLSPNDWCRQTGLSVAYDAELMERQ